MSGFLAIYNPKGAPVAAPRLTELAAGLDHRAVDGRNMTIDGPVGLAHLWFNTTDQTGPGPYELGDPHLLLTLDARLDDPFDLARKLGVTTADDATLILLSYRKWGADCVHHLRGDFAFVIWDKSAQQLFCARDPFGVKPFFYTSQDDQFIAASEPGPILSAMGGLHPDQNFIADFLVGHLSDDARTGFADVTRLPPAHTLTVTKGCAKLSRYWALRQTELQIDDASEQLRQLLDQSVKRRMKGRDVGAMLSGGLDSSSIACLAQRYRSDLPVFSLIFNDPDLDERPYIQQTLDQYAVRPHMVQPGQGGAFAGGGRLLGEQAYPFLAPGHVTSRPIYAAARRSGVRVLLDGHGGDEVIGHGFERLSELARAGHWRKLWVEAAGTAGLDGLSPWAVFSSALMTHTPLSRVSGWTSRFRRTTAAVPAWRRLLRQDFTHDNGIIDRLQARQKAIGSTPFDRYRATLQDPLIPHAFEVLNTCAATHGVETRFPFFDLDLVEFCASLPASDRLNNGWTRWVLRQAMTDILPQAVQWRRSKTDFTAHMLRQMLDQDGDILRDIVFSDCTLFNYVEATALRQTYDRVTRNRHKADRNDIFGLWRATWVGLWLRQLESQAATPKRQVPA
ncbi:asparagine synthase-related protein [Pseudaestuariivita rosea]|uniref:asparagine synthase-related protein n=1 Tax=Pseudaestuariivita rosea TaxID=2763263 RepID=UPI001ABB9C8E|nr:asparagine synthase-related protein [Pseudaestuariivita rosea]